MASATDFSRAVGRRIAEVRRARGLTQEALAARLGTGVKNYQRVEAGQNLTLRSLAELAEVLTVAPAELVVPMGAPISGAPADPFDGLANTVASLTPTRTSPMQVPVLTLQIAAGPLGAGSDATALGFARLRGRRARPPAGTFIARVVGDSMAPLIPRGAWCLFGPVRSARWEGAIVLFEHRAWVDPDTGGAYGVKEVECVRDDDAGQRWVRFRPRNGRYRAFELPADETLRPIAEWVEALTE